MNPDSIGSDGYGITNLGELLRQKLKAASEDTLDKFTVARASLWDDHSNSLGIDLSPVERRISPQRIVIDPNQYRFYTESNALSNGLAHNFNTKKETKQMNYNALVQLADNDFAKEVQKYTGNSLGIKNALERKLAKRKEEAEEAAADVILQLMDKKDQMIEHKVNRIREYRRMIKELQTDLETLNKSTEYGNATNNFLPLMSATGMLYLLSSPVEKKLLEIPADFKVEAEVEAA